jgi:hypothetical protein
MDDTTATPGTLEKFHLGITADGSNCLLMFIDEREHAISCVASFEDFNAFIASLMRTAAEMSRRRGGLKHVIETGPVPEITVTSAAFHMQDECMMGSLMGDGGEVVGLRLHPSVVNEMTRAMLLAAPPASAC